MAAKAAGFVDLTPGVHAALECIATGPGAPDACPALARISSSSLLSNSEPESASNDAGQHAHPWLDYKLSQRDVAMITHTCTAEDVV